LERDVRIVAKQEEGSTAILDRLELVQLDDQLARLGGCSTRPYGNGRDNGSRDTLHVPHYKTPIYDLATRLMENSGDG
jgi:hypothetical protein